MKLTKSELHQLKILSDPVLWAEATLKDPKYPKKPLAIRDYQAEMLNDRSVRRVSRCGRRIGKTLVMVVHILWYAFTHTNSRQVIATPYDSQAALIFDMIRQFIEGTESLKQSVKSNVKSPHYKIELKNGAIISGFTAGTRSGAEGGSLRGQAADWLYMDEMDYMSDKDFEAIYAIALEAPERIGVWISSTPTGRRGKFWAACFAPETKILCEDGNLKNIEDIVEGDKVIGAHGHIEEVKTKFITQTEEKLYRIKTWHLPFSVKCTGEHPILTIDGWKAAHEIVPGDYIQVTLPREFSKTILEYEFRDIELERLEIAKSELPVGKAAEYFNKDRGTISSIRKQYEESGWLGLLDKRRRDNYLLAKDIIDNKVQSKEFARLLGYYIAEGNIIKDTQMDRVYDKGIMFTFNIKEKEYIQEVTTLLKDLFGLESSIYERSEDNKASISCHCSYLATAIKALVGEKTDKQIPSEIMESNYDLELLDTLFKGDGYIKPDGSVRLELTAKKAAIQSFQIMIKNGIQSSMTYKDIPGKKDTICSNKMINNWDTYRFDNGEYYVKVKSNSRVKNKSKVVYNFETDKTNTYTANFLSVHNCQPDSGWTEFYYPTMVNPEWSPSMEKELKNMYSEQGYTHEILAEFGEETVGVFRKDYIDRARTEYLYESLPTKKGIRMIGVDWDRLFVPIKWCELLETPKAA